MISKDKVTEIFCSIDDFCKEFVPLFEKRLLGVGKKRKRASRLSLSEVMTIQVLFHLSRIRDFKTFYTGYVKEYLVGYFPDTVSYNRMVELCSESMLPLLAYLKTQGTGSCSGISFIDSTPLRVCHNRRIHSHKVFDVIAQRGQCSIGWFFGFKLHIVTNDSGHIIDFLITPGNKDDRTPLRLENFIAKLWGKLYGDKGYIGKELFTELFSNGIHLVTKLKKNMKTKLLTPMYDVVMLRKRAIVESIIDQLKNIFQIEHSRYRSPVNFFTNVCSGLIAYNFTEKKPSLNINFVRTDQLCLNL
ncbi:IS982 family transposase [Flavivirga spongiicola]|uniref:IS982 family transposase n=1 Tax=Flavivirga spongiicola TaxID=421621 RepID=A0ABU7XTU1_9FLAO|nr:IS982 family transposase [Flavivirga sp. MEBiC05379]MDO5978844.1 IS982 family transposase [Flavivirga sp. MEBiC05379]